MCRAACVDTGTWVSGSLGSVRAQFLWLPFWSRLAEEGKAIKQPQPPTSTLPLGPGRAQCLGHRLSCSQIANEGQIQGWEHVNVLRNGAHSPVTAHGGTPSAQLTGGEHVLMPPPKGRKCIPGPATGARGPQGAPAPSSGWASAGGAAFPGRVLLSH